MLKNVCIFPIIVDDIKALHIQNHNKNLSNKQLRLFRQVYTLVGATGFEPAA